MVYSSQPFWINVLLKHSVLSFPEDSQLCSSSFSLLFYRQWGRIAQSVWWLDYKSGKWCNQDLFDGKGRHFPLLHSIRTGSGTHPATYSVNDGRWIHRSKATGTEADHTPPSSAMFMNTCSLLSVHVTWCLYEHSDNLHFVFTYLHVVHTRGLCTIQACIWLTAMLMERTRILAYFLCDVHIYASCSCFLGKIHLYLLSNNHIKVFMYYLWS